MLRILTKFKNKMQMSFFSYCWRDNAESSHLMSKRMSTLPFTHFLVDTYHLHLSLPRCPLPGPPHNQNKTCPGSSPGCRPATSPLASTALLWVWPQNSLCGSAKHHLFSLRESEQLLQQNSMQMAQTNTFWKHGLCKSNMFIKIWQNWLVKNLFLHKS